MARHRQFGVKRRTNTVSTKRRKQAAPDLPEVEAYVRRLSEAAENVRVSELFEENPEALYQIRNRNGVSVVALRAGSLTEEQTVRILTYRLGQYLHSAVGMLNARTIFESGWEHEPLSEVTPSDVHVIAGKPETGEILCYAVLRALPHIPPGATLRTRDHAQFQVEKTHGWGIFNRLQLLPDLPLENVRELGRFIKNHGIHTFDELGARAPVEVGAALFRTVVGPLLAEVAGLVGDLEEGVAKQNLDFFHMQMVIIRGTVPYAPEDSFASPRYQYRTVFPFAALTSDYRAALPRLAEIEAALEEPGKRGLLALFALKRTSRSLPSSLEPPGGLAPLAEIELSQEDLPMHARREMLATGGQVRQIELFSGLSVAEAALLGTFMERSAAEPGDLIVRQGEPGGDLYVIHSGEAEVRVKGRAKAPLVLARLGPGQYFGEISLLTAGERTADVVAITPMQMMSLSRDSYLRFLSHAAEVEEEINRTAASRSENTRQRLQTEAEQ